MGDPFSEENIALFEQQRGSPERPPQAYLPFGRPLSDIMEETPRVGAPNTSQDVVDEEARRLWPCTTQGRPADKDFPKAFDFVIRYIRLNPWLVVLAALLLVAIIILAVEMHLQTNKSSQRNNPLPNALTYSSEIPSGTSREASSYVVITTSSTSYSGFNAVIVSITETKQRPQPTVDPSTSDAQETAFWITMASPSTTFQTTVATTVFEPSEMPASTPAETALRSLDPHGLTVYNFVAVDSLNQTLPLSKRRLRQSGIDATKAKVVTRPTGWRSRRSDV